jgi:uncharacterized membrane protein YgdD (TMEM256/DUF423 family)
LLLNINFIKNVVNITCITGDHLAQSNLAAKFKELGIALFIGSIISLSLTKTKKIPVALVAETDFRQYDSKSF